jgi:hypothetical protein
VSGLGKYGRTDGSRSATFITDVKTNPLISFFALIDNHQRPVAGMDKLSMHPYTLPVTEMFFPNGNRKLG